MLIGAISSADIHPTAVIHKGSQIADDARIGPYSIIGENVIIGSGTSIASHVVIEGWTRIGKNNRIETGAVIGSYPQDLKFKGEVSSVTVGDGNIIREYVTINRGTAGGGGKTLIGNNNLIMTSAHIAHDVSMGNYNIIANGTAVGGHVVIENWVTVGALSGIHQFTRVGQMSMVGAMSRIVKDVVPYALVTGNPAQYCGVNVERLRREGFDQEARLQIQRSFKILFHQGLTITEAIYVIEQKYHYNHYIMHLVSFLKNSSRGFYR
jgi:UDP-N-acetylglucosamine acyltransferase